MLIRRRDFSGLQLVPPLLVGPARAVLRGQGINAQVLSDQGELDAMGVLSLAFDTITVKTRLSSPVKITIAGGPSDPAADAMLREVQPALVFSGRAGTVKLAPYGDPTTISGAIQRAGPLIGVGIGAALLGILLLGGAIFRPRAPRRLAGYRRR